MKLNNTSAIITGAASGMGYAVAKMLASQGAKLGLIDLNQDQLNEVAEELGGVAIACDVSQSEQVTDAFDKIREQQGIARICVNCAGIAPAGRIVTKQGPMPLDDFSRVINVNLIGTFNVMRIAAAHMYEAEPLGESQERGIIINTASVAAFEGQIGQAAYSASKGGVVAMMLPAAREFANFGIRVNTVAPGIVATPMLTAMPEQVQEALAASVPFPKRLAKPEEFAKLVCHIIDNEMINAETIRLDGAIRMQAK